MPVCFPDRDIPFLESAEGIFGNFKDALILSKPDPIGMANRIPVLAFIESQFENMRPEIFLILLQGFTPNFILLDEY